MSYLFVCVCTRVPMSCVQITCGVALLLCEYAVFSLCVLYFCSIYSIAVMCIYSIAVVCTFVCMYVCS